MVLALPNTIHNNMDDRDDETDHKVIANYVLTFIND